LDCENERLEISLIGPDFPGGGIILNRRSLLDIYEQGEGTIYIRGKAEIISSKKDKEKKDLIHITELPFKVNKAKLVERISQIIKDKDNKIEGLLGVADYSNWEEKVNIHLKINPNHDGKIILNKLYRRTALQSTFSVKMRALIAEQPDIFPLRKTLQGFIAKRLENIEKKAQFLHRKNQKELLNLETRRFIVENYQEIAQIIRNSSSEEESKQNLLVRFREELQGLKSLTLDLLLTNLISQTRSSIDIIQRQSYQKGVEYKELTKLLGQIDNYKGEESYQNKENEINELREKVNCLNHKELLSAFTEQENFPNPEQQVINRILDTPASFRQFTPERREKLQKEITDLQQENIELQLLITDEEKKKQKLIQELQELQKAYAHDQRRTKFSDEVHTIEERELIPYEERIVVLSQTESRKDKSVNSYLNVHELEAVEATNIPSQGKELKTRGDNLAFLKLSRRDNL
jgi:DNA gyrase/topoisomerase IV subunit A